MSRRCRSTARSAPCWARPTASSASATSTRRKATRRRANAGARRWRSMRIPEPYRSASPTTASPAAAATPKEAAGADSRGSAGTRLGVDRPDRSDRGQHLSAADKEREASPPYPRREEGAYGVRCRLRWRRRHREERSDAAIQEIEGRRRSGDPRPSTRFGASSARKLATEAKNHCICRLLLRTAPMPNSCFRRRGVDGRDKPGHDGQGSKEQSAKPDRQLAPQAPLRSHGACFGA